MRHSNYQKHNFTDRTYKFSTPVRKIKLMKYDNNNTLDKDFYPEPQIDEKYQSENNDEDEGLLNGIYIISPIKCF
jgi:hypothetical protein